MEKGYFHTDLGYWQATNEPDSDVLRKYPVGTTEVPLKPGSDYRWDGVDWVRVTPDPTEELLAWRSAASLPKAEFCVGLINLGILSVEDAVSASRGNWPMALDGFLSYLTPEQSAQVQIEWATRVQIHRMNTFVLLLASYLGLSDDTVDTLFGRNVT